MSASPATRRAMAEIDFGDGANVSFKVGNRSIHQFWHLFSSHFRHVFLAPQRRADSGKVAWTWREAGEKRPVTATELVEVRRRLSEANRSLVGGFGGMGRRDDDEASSLDGQVRASVGEMVGQLLAQRDSALTGFVCRTDAGLMLHSWGAAVAAQPYFPDAQHGEISGTVFVGVERVAGISVVLENTQGIGGARVKSDKDGVFRFPNVAPGSYHLRVADRSDFPGGLTVEIERESITGLELRSASDEPLSMSGNITPMAEDVSWFRRRWAGLVLLLLILGAGMFAWWWSTRSSEVQAVAQNQSSSWRSAKGQLAVNDPRSRANDDHKVGQEGAFSALSSSIPPPKVLHPRPDRAPSETDGAASDHASQSAEDSAVPGQRLPEEKKPPADSNRKPIPRTDAVSVHATRDPPNLSSNNAEEKVRPSEDEPGTIPDGDDVKSVKDKPAKSSQSKVNRKKAGTPAASSPAIDESPDESAAPAASGATTDSAASAAVVSNGGKSAEGGRAKNPAATSAAVNAEAADSNAETGASDSPTSGPSPAVSGQLKPSPGNKAKASAKGPTANAAAVASVEFRSISGGETPENSPSLEDAGNKQAVKNSLSNKTNPRNQTPLQAESNTSSNQEDTASSPASTPLTFSSQKPKQPSVAAEEKSVPTTQTNESPAAATEAEADQSTAAQSPNPVGNTLQVKRPKPPKKPASASSVQPEERSESPETESATGLSTTIPAASTIVAEESDGPLIPIGIIHASVWKQRMVRDQIVPTHPVTEAEEETMEALQERFRQEQTKRMPKAFQQPQMSGGIVVDFGAAPNKENPPRWRNGSGAEPTGSSVSGQRAELRWNGGIPPANTTYTLSDSAGRVIAVASVDGSGGLTLKTTARSHAWCWCGIERTLVDASAAFDWKLLSGADIPASWTRDDHWLAGRGQRIDIPLDATTKRVGNYQVALIDPAAGWALVSDIGLQAP